jgi:hypothetical protein
MSKQTSAAAKSPAIGAAVGRGVADGSGDEVLSAAGSTSGITFAGGRVGDAEGKSVGDADGKGVGASIGAGLAEATGAAAIQMQASGVILLHKTCKGFSSVNTGGHDNYSWRQATSLLLA